MTSDDFTRLTHFSEDTRKRYEELKKFLESGENAAELTVYKEANQDRASYISQASKLWRNEGIFNARRLEFRARKGRLFVQIKEQKWNEKVTQ